MYLLNIKTLLMRFVQNNLCGMSRSATYLITTALLLFCSSSPTFAVSSEVQSRVDDVIVICVGSPKAYVNSSKTMIDFENPDVVPIIKNGVTLLPAKFISENLGATISFNKESSTVNILLNGKTAKFTLKSRKALVNNSEITLEVPAESRNGRLYLPLRTLVQDVFNKKIFYYKGVIIISDIDNIINLQTEKSSAEDIVQWFKDSELLKIGTKYGWGYINRKTGEMAIKPKFYVAREFHEGFAPVMVYKDKIEKWGYINTNGEYVIEPIFNDVYDFSEDLACVSIDKGNGPKYGFIDKKGNFIIEPKFQDAFPFSEGLAAVEADDGTWGFIDKSGSFVIGPKYYYAFMFTEGIAQVHVDGIERWGYINKKGEYVIEPDNYGVGGFVSEGLISFRSGDWDSGKEGYMDTKGNIVIQPQFYYASNFSEGLANVRIGDWENGVEGYIDKSGKMVIPPTRGAKGSFVEGLAIACLGEWEDGSKQGFIDKTGRIVIKQEFDEVFCFSEGLALVKKDGKWNYIDRKGNLVFDL